MLPADCPKSDQGGGVNIHGRWRGCRRETRERSSVGAVVDGLNLFGLRTLTIKDKSQFSTSYTAASDTIHPLPSRT